MQYTFCIAIHVPYIGRSMGTLVGLTGRSSRGRRREMFHSFGKRWDALTDQMVAKSRYKHY